MRSKTVIVGFLGYLSQLIKEDPDALEKLKAQVRAETKAAMLLKKASLTEAVIESLDGQESKEEKSFKGHLSLNYANYVLRPLWKELGLERKLDYHWEKTQAQFDAPELLWQTVVNRIVSPCSHYRHYEERLNWLGAPLNEASVWDLYRMLDFACEQKDRILKTTNQNIEEMGLRDLSVVFYDCTNSWYETPYTDAQKLEMKIASKLASLDPNASDDQKKKAIEDVITSTSSTLRMRGPSKEGRHDPLVSIALVVDRNGIPIDFYVYPGNASEKTTMEESIKALEQKYGIKNTIVVADGGLNTKPNIMKLADRKHGFLLSRSVPKMKEALLDKVLADEGWQEFSEGTLRLKELEMEMKGADGEPIRYRLVAGWSHKRYQEDLFRIAALRKSAERAVKDKRNMKQVSYGWRKYVVSADSKAKKLNEDRIKKDERIAGYFAYEFKDGRDYDEDWAKNPTRVMGVREVMEQYHNLAKIEECFRIMKSNFELRPFFVYTDEHIKAQVLICVLALIMIRVLAKKLEKQGHPMSIDEIQYALANAQVAVMARKNNPVMFAPLRMERIRIDPKDGKSPKFELYGETDLSRIMEAVGLKTLPEYCEKDELARCLSTRFNKDTDAVGYLCHRVI